MPPVNCTRLSISCGFIVGVEAPTAGDPRVARLLKVREAWDKHKNLAERGSLGFDPALQAQVVEDLRDLVILGAHLNISLATTDATKNAARLEAAALQHEAEQLLGVAPANTAARNYAAGVMKLRSDDLASALAAFDSALELQPNHFWSNFQHGVTSYRLGKFQDALADFRACIALAPKSADCFHNRALLLSSLHEYDRALRDYEHAIELRPDFFDAALNAGQLHFQLGQFERAKALLKRALEIFPDSEQAQYNLALVYLKEGDRPNALACLEKARSIPQASELRDRLLSEQPSRRR